MVFFVDCGGIDYGKVRYLVVLGVGVELVGGELVN